MMTEISAFLDGAPDDAVGDNWDMAACKLSCSPVIVAQDAGVDGLWSDDSKSVILARPDGELPFLKEDSTEADGRTLSASHRTRRFESHPACTIRTVRLGKTTRSHESSWIPSHHHRSKRQVALFAVARR